MGAGTLVHNIRRTVTRFHMGTESVTGRGRLARTTYAEPSPGVLNAAYPKTAAHRKQQPFPEQRSPSTAMVLTSGDGSPCEARNNRPRSRHPRSLALHLRNQLPIRNSSHFPNNSLPLLLWCTPWLTLLRKVRTSSGFYSEQELRPRAKHGITVPEKEHMRHGHVSTSIKSILKSRLVWSKI